MCFNHWGRSCRHIGWSCWFLCLLFGAPFFSLPSFIWRVRELSFSFFRTKFLRTELLAFLQRWKAPLLLLPRFFLRTRVPYGGCDCFFRTQLMAFLERWKTVLFHVMRCFLFFLRTLSSPSEAVTVAFYGRNGRHVALSEFYEVCWLCAIL